MRIEYYNSNNEMTSKKEYKTNIPKCVKKFIDARPLVNINMEEYKLLKSKKNKTKRDFLIDTLKYYLKFDYSLFLQCEKCRELYKLLSNTLRVGFEPDSFRSKNIVQEIIRRASMMFDEYNLEEKREQLWINYVTSESTLTWKQYYHQNYKNFSVPTNTGNTIPLTSPYQKIRITSANLYRSLLKICRTNTHNKKKKLSNSQKRFDVITSLLPSSYSSSLSPFSFDDENFISSVAINLYEIGEKKRSDLYGIIYTYNYYVTMITDPHAFGEQYIRRINSPEYVFVFTNKNNSYIDIVLTSEEKASLRVKSKDANRIIQNAKDLLATKYNEYVLYEKTYIEQQIDIQIYNKLGISSKECKNKDWKQFLLLLKSDIERTIDLSMPGTDPYLYNLLFSIHDMPNTLFDFNDSFVKGLLVVCEKLNGIRLNEIFDNIYALNYVKAKMTTRQSRIVNDPFVKSDFEIIIETYPRVYKRIIDFLHPILNDEEFIENYWLKKIGNRDFSKKLKILIEEEKNDESSNFIQKNILINCPYNAETKRGFNQGFNIKLLCNIIGALTSKKGQNDRVFKYRKADPIIKKLCVSRGLSGTGSYKNYINGYKDIKYNSYNTLLEKETILYIQKLFNVKEDEFLPEPQRDSLD